MSLTATIPAQNAAHRHDLEWQKVKGQRSTYERFDGVTIRKHERGFWGVYLATGNMAAYVYSHNRDAVVSQPAAMPSLTLAKMMAELVDENTPAHVNRRGEHVTA